MANITVTPAEIEQIRAKAECLYTRAQVDAAVRDMAAAITLRLGQRDPLILCVMVGGLVPTAWLLPQLDFPLQLDYVHVTRYQGNTHGGALDWIKAPELLTGRHVLIVDDILDRGYTLEAIIMACRQAGAAEVLSAVLVDKQIKRHDSLQQADFTGVTVPNRYVFGCGMDYKGYLRNAPGIYAVEGL